VLTPGAVLLCVQGQGELQLLHNISGSFRPGVLTALMGVSGEPRLGSRLPGDSIRLQEMCEARGLWQASGRPSAETQLDNHAEMQSVCAL
jgi:hypothetical protein